MPTMWETYPIKLEGGLITNLGRLEHGADRPGSATTLQNFEADVRGGYTRILGFTKFSEDVVPNAGVVKGIVAVESNKVLAFRGADVFSSSGGAWTSVLTIPNTTYEKISYDNYDYGAGEHYVVVDGVNTPAFFNVVAGTMAYGVGFPVDVIGASYVRNFKSHLFYAVGNTVVFSAPFTDNDFTPANGSGIIDVGDEITGMIAFREQLFIFCANKIFRISGNALADFVLAPVTTNTGCIAGHTIQEVGGDIMYLSLDGVRYLSASERDNDFGLTRASEKIQSEFSRINASTQYTAITISPKNQYRLFVYSSTTQVAKSVGYIGVKFSNQTAENIAWSTTLGIKAYATTKFTSVGGEDYFFSNETDYVYRMESGSSFDGTAIPAIFETPYTPISDPAIRKTMYKHTIYTRMSASVDLTLRVLYDYNRDRNSIPDLVSISSESTGATYGSGSSVYGTSVYGGSTEVQFYNNIIGSGFVVAFRYENTSISPSFNLNFVVVEYKSNERR